MARQTINIGSTANDGTGDPLRTCFDKINDNFGEVYSRFQTEVPSAETGSVGDTAGMYAADATHFYYCHAEYDGSTAIWLRIAGSSF